MARFPDRAGAGILARAWLLTTIAVLEMALLAEPGPRFVDFNYWGVAPAQHLLFLTASCELLAPRHSLGAVVDELGGMRCSGMDARAATDRSANLRHELIPRLPFSRRPGSPAEPEASASRALGGQDVQHGIHRIEHLVYAASRDPLAFAEGLRGDVQVRNEARAVRGLRRARRREPSGSVMARVS